MHHIMYNFRINAQVCIYSLVDLNIDLCTSVVHVHGVRILKQKEIICIQSSLSTF